MFWTNLYFCSSSSHSSKISFPIFLSIQSFEQPKFTPQYPLSVQAFCFWFDYYENLWHSLPPACRRKFWSLAFDICSYDAGWWTEPPCKWSEQQPRIGLARSTMQRLAPQRREEGRNRQLCCPELAISFTFYRSNMPSCTSCSDSTCGGEFHSCLLPHH